MLSYILAPDPIWYFFDKDGKPAAGGKIQTYNAKNHNQPKAAYSDETATNPYPAGDDGIPLDATGKAPNPIYWEIGGDLYYIVVRDKDNNIIGNPIDNFPITSGTGGGPPITVNQDIENHIINGNFSFTANELFSSLPADDNAILPISPVPVGATPVAPGGGTLLNTLIAGRSSSDIQKSLANNNFIAFPGWFFQKTGGATNTDTISFSDTVGGLGLPSGPTRNAPRYFTYNLSANPSPATVLDLVYQIPDVRTFSDDTLTITFDCKGNGPSNPTELIIEQDFGTGGNPSVSTILPFTFPNGVWDRLSLTTTVPTISGLSIGGEGDDNIKFRWRFPVNNIGIYDFTNAQIQVGTFGVADFIYKTRSQTAADLALELLYSAIPSTGTIKYSYNPNAAPGWIVQINIGETIGSTASGATHAGEFVRTLYRVLYTFVIDTYAPVSGGRTGNADADFNANKTLTLPEHPGRVQAAVDSAAVSVGQTAGDDMHTNTEAEMFRHSHTYTGTTLAVGFEAGPNLGLPFTTTTSFEGNSQPYDIRQKTIYTYIHWKL